MKRKLHINTGSRRTMVTISETIFQLMSIKLSGQLNQSREVSKFLSEQLQAKHGSGFGKRSSVNIGLSEWISDIIISNIAQPELINAHEKMIDAGL